MQTLWEHYRHDSNIAKTFLYNTVRFLRNANVPMDTQNQNSWVFDEMDDSGVYLKRGESIAAEKNTNW